MRTSELFTGSFLFIVLKISFLCCFFSIVCSYIFLFLDIETIRIEKLDKLLKNDFFTNFSKMVLAPVLETLLIWFLWKLSKNYFISKFFHTIIIALLIALLHFSLYYTSGVFVIFFVFIFFVGVFIYWAKQDIKKGFWCSSVSHSIYNLVLTLVFI